jgi:hypothetical protein
MAQFHEFVLEGNDSALEQFYESSGQSPVLGDMKFRNELMGTPLRVDREHPRYERAAVRPSLHQLLELCSTNNADGWYSLLSPG